MTDFTQSIMRTKRRALERRIDDIPKTSTKCPIARELLAKIARARDQLLTFCDFPGEVEPTNNGSERAPRPAAIQRKVTNGFRAKWAADHDTAARTTLDTARLGGGEPFQTILRRSRSDAKTASGAVRTTRALQIAKFTPKLGNYLLTTRFTVSRFIPAKSAPACLCPYERGASRDLRAARKTPPPTISSPHPRSCTSGTYRPPDVCNSPRNASLTVASAQLVRITHPFHPFADRQLVCVGERYNRYGKRLLLRVDDRHDLLGSAAMDRHRRCRIPTLSWGKGERFCGSWT